MKPIEDYVVSIPDFPEPGIIFRDVTSVLQDAEGLHLAIDLMQEKLEGLDFDVVVGPESRGFIFGVPIAYNLKKPFIPIRKKGKLPRETVSAEYELEYGTATIEMHKDAIKPGQRVVIIDDLIATGGTNEAMIHLIEGLGGKVVKTVFLMELAGLHGRDRLQGYDIDGDVIKAARENAKRAGVEELIHFQQRPVKELHHPKKYGFIITNPPYGERLEEKEALPALYKEIGMAYQNLDAWSLYMITSYEDAEKYIGRKADKNRKIYNGMLKTYFYQFLGPKPPKRNRK